MIGSADLHQALNTAWDASGLDALFTAYWESGVGDFEILADREAAPGQPFPYCVFQILAGITQNRMSDCSESSTTIREVRDMPLMFVVLARQMADQSASSKAIAAALAEEIMKVFGGHPTVQPSALVLSNGNHLITTYQNDFGMVEGEDEYSWTINYLVKVDVPVQALTA